MTPALLAEGLCKQFGGLNAVDGVSLALQRGQIHALIGTNGAGKSTVINLLSGELPLSSGSVTLLGHDVGGLSPAARSQRGLGRSYQRSNVFMPLSVFENVRLCAQSRAAAPWRFWQAAQHCTASITAAHQALERVGLAAEAHKAASALSHGQKRQLEIAMCLATQPQVLLLDEPLAGMGQEESERMLALLQTLKADHAILLVEHDMQAVFAVADLITVMVNGKPLASGSVAEIRANAAVQAAYLGDETAH